MLTRRQQQVCELVARGLTDKAIARETGLSVRTVQVHLQNAAVRIPVEGTPRHRCYVWFLRLRAEDERSA